MLAKSIAEKLLLLIFYDLYNRVVKLNTTNKQSEKRLNSYNFLDKV